MDNMTVEQVIALFHDETPVSHELVEIRNQSFDRRWILYVNFENVKYVIKIAGNSFTKADRVSAWPKLIEEYAKMGYYSPAICRDRNGNYAGVISFGGAECVVWEEEFAKYRLGDSFDEAALKDGNGRWVYRDEVIGFVGRIAQRHLTGFPAKSGWVRIEAVDEPVDEVTECEETFDELVRERAPEYLDRWTGIRALFDENREKLRAIYDRLPTSVFQADWGRSNLLLDDEGHFKGVIDYNLSGEDTALNMFLSMIMFGFAEYSEAGGPEDLPYLNVKTREAVLNSMLSTIAQFREHYQFSELEAQAAPLLYKYIGTIEYSAIDALEQNIGHPQKLNRLFDFIEHELLREIDFRPAMFG